MTKEFFLELLTEVLQRDDLIQASMKLEDIEEYDSMSMLNVMVLIDTEFDKLLTTKDLEDCESVQDILDLVKENLE
jgi:acyl carrier protein|tara:strand:+ start:69 stop:296 length:228 start_codon:yes stop_codon:yes gene_type:complete